MHHKTNLLQNFISLAIWIFFISAGTKAGLDLVDFENHKEVITFSQRLFKIAYTFFSFCMGVALYYRYANTKNSLSFLVKFANKIFGDGFSETFNKKLCFHILCPLFFILIGLVGLTKALILNVHKSIFYELLMPFSFGIGMVFPYILKKMLSKN